MTAFQTNAFDTNEASEASAELLQGSDSEGRNDLSSFDLIDQLIGQYRVRENQIDQTKALIDAAVSQGVMKYFLDGAQLTYGNEYRFSLPDNPDSAKCSLRIEFWNRLLNNSDILALMPAVKRAEAAALFSGLQCPPFDESTVRPTMQDLLAQRKTFFAERVDGIFRELSGSHVTNVPSGFSKKMIIAGVFDSFGNAVHDKCAIISDLRGVVGKLTGRGEPSEYGTRKLLAKLYSNHLGKKVSIDGGAFYCTVYQRGTMHFEVAPEVAVELNSVLANLYPMAIPSRFMSQPKNRKTSFFELRTERLPFAVIDMISEMEFKHGSYTMSSVNKSEDQIEQAIRVLESIGATVTISRDKYYIWVEFDYPATEVINQIMFSGVIPEKVSHQFYRSTGRVAEVAAERLQVLHGHKCCEPSAGLGDLAQYLPMESSVCVEISRVRAKVLQAKGFATVQEDFLAWAPKQTDRYDRVLMNPPFSKGRALRHLIAAAGLLEADGRLVAILPASMVNTLPLDGFVHDWSEIFQDQFEGTAVQVVILTAFRKG